MDRPNSRPELFGRDAELARLEALFTSAGTADRGRAALVTGPAGVGKSRLMAELKHRLRQTGEPVLEAWCRQTDHRPHGPLVDLLGGAIALLADLGRDAPRVERALNLIAGLQAPVEGGAEGLDLHFREAVRQALVELAEVKPAVIFLHDLHRADGETLQLIRYLLENLLTDPAFEWTGEVEGVSHLPTDTFRGLLVLSFREGPETALLRDTARASVAVERIELGGLDESGVRAFLQSPKVVQRLLAASSGLPVALEQLVDAIPDNPSAAWSTRLEAVPEEHHPLLDVLAVYGRPATPAHLKQLGDLEGDPRATVIKLAEQRVIERSLDGGVVRFRFVRTGAREAWYEALGEARRHALHGQVAERLAMATALGVEPEEVAHHYILGGRRAEAIPFAMAAAERLRSALAYGRAATLLESVREAADGDLAAEILERLVELYTASNRVDDARRSLAELAASAPGRAGDLQELRLARLHARAGDPVQAGAAAERALAKAEAEQEGELRSIAAEAAYQRGDLVLAGEHADTLKEGAQDPAALALRNTVGKIHLAREDLDEAQSAFGRNLELAREIGDEVHQARALINLGVVHLQRGDPDEALRHFESAQRLCTRTGDLRHLAVSVENLAVLYHRRQAYGRALAYHHQSTAAFRRLGHRAQLATTALNLGELYLTVGDLERARRLGAIAAEHVRRDGLRFLEAQSLQLEGASARAAGDLERAASRYDAAIHLIEQGAGNNQRLGSMRLALAEIRIEQEQPAAARELLGDAPPDTPQARMVRGALLFAEGRPVEARPELEAALEAAEGAEARETGWQIQEKLAQVYWAMDDRAATLTALAAAVEGAERVAEEMPPSMRARYRDAPARRRVRDALRRVRAGLPPTGGAQPEVRMPRQTGGYQARWAERYPRIIGRAPSLHSVFNTLDRVSGSDSMVLVRGESGTGKELVAAALHAHSPRAKGPFVKVNCSAFVETLLLSELFGHEKGAFTGAVASKKGRFELAHQGTLFLDEIGDISPNTQVALLRVLQEGTFERVGGQQTVEVDVRVICATHRNLEQMVSDNTFRADLYYRLRGVIIELPSLAERSADIPALVDHFLSRRQNARSRPLRFSRPALASLLQHDWPGNIRELENVVRSVALFADGNEIGLAELAELGDIFRPPEEAALEALEDLDVARAAELAETPAPEAAPPPQVAHGPAEPKLDDAWLSVMLAETGSLSDLKKRIEFEAIARALRATKGNITRAAGALGMKRPRLSQIIHATPELGEIKREVGKA